MWAQLDALLREDDTLVSSPSTESLQIPALVVQNGTEVRAPDADVGRA